MLSMLNGFKLSFVVRVFLLLTVFSFTSSLFGGTKCTKNGGQDYLDGICRLCAVMNVKHPDLIEPCTKKYCSFDAIMNQIKTCSNRCDDPTIKDAKACSDVSNVVAGMKVTCCAWK